MFEVNNVASDLILTPRGTAAPAGDNDGEGGEAGVGIEEFSGLLDGTDARYMGIANKRVFSTPRVGVSVANSTSQHAYPMPSSSMYSRDMLSTPVTRSFVTASSAVTMATMSQQLTPVRHPSLGRLSQQHTPYHHCTSYDHDRYQRLLTNAVLSGSEAGRSSSVLSFPMRTPTRVGRPGCQATPDPSVTSGGTQRGTALSDNHFASRTSILEAPKEMTSIVNSACPSQGQTTALIDERARPLVGPAAGKAQQGGGFMDGTSLWSPWEHARRGGEGASDIAGLENASDDSVHNSCTPAPLVYFQRAPSVWPSSLPMSMRPPSTRNNCNSRRGVDESCGAVVLSLTATEEDEAGSSLHAVQRAQRTCEGFGVAEVSGFPHTPVLTHSDPTAYMSVAGASSFTPRNSPCASLPEGEAGELDGANTPHCLLPPSMAQYASFYTPPAPAPVLPTLELPGSRHRKVHEVEGGKPPALFLSTPLDCVTEASCATPRAPSVTASLTSAEPPSSSAGKWVLATTRTSSLPPDSVHRRSTDNSALSSSSIRRQLATPQNRLFTPVRRADNSIRSALATGPSATASGDMFCNLWSSPRPRSAPLDVASSTKLPATHHRGVSHRREGGAGATHSHAHGQLQQLRSHTRFTFEFIRALTAGHVSTDARHQSMFWGCFGILVAQLREVWCVGKANPFRLFPSLDVWPAWMPCMEELEVTAVCTTERLSLVQWEAASITTDTPEESPPIVVYAVIGTSAGDVFVYGYSKCSPTLIDAIPVTLDTEQGLAQSTYTVRLQQQGVLQRADRVRGSDGVSNVHTSDSTVHESPTIGGNTVSVVRVIDHWLYIGDQSGNVARYNLRNSCFLQSVSGAESPPTRTPTSVKRAEGKERDYCYDPAIGRLLLRLRSRIPDRGVKPPLLLTRASPRAKSSTHTQSAPAASTPMQRFHYAVNVGEPVYHLEVTSNQSYIAVGTQTRLLVYRTAQLTRVSVTSSSLQSPLLPSHASFTGTSVGPSYHTGGSCDSYAMHEHGDSATPQVVVSHASQPMRCFAWMLCDYESLMQSPDARALEERHSAFSHTGDDDSDASCLVVPTSDDEVSIEGAPPGFSAQCSAYSRHTPIPSLVYATACQQPIEVAESQSPQHPAPQMKTDIRVFRVATQTTVTSCTLDYPVHVLTVLSGTTKIIVGTGGAMKLGHGGPLGAPSSADQRPTTSSQTLADSFRGLSLSSSGTFPALRATSLATAAAGAATTFISQAVVGHRPSLAVLAAETLRHRPHTTRITTHHAVPMDAGAAHVQQRQQGVHARETKKGYMFLLELCPADDPAVIGDEGVEYRVYLRVRGEVRLGEGESALCGALSPEQDHIAVLICPTESDPPTVASPPLDASRTRMKVWRIDADVPSASIVSNPRGLLSLSESQQIENLR
ncbi:hypothetical protein JKF63_02248 [Porcisia hertigi]|uniref:Uncharacterized protein n=1 Tax=Porcisia hertigi TaxID=2761500 RepID=A0A836IIC2_9TRYP|nr:hypothetical protein JKF63_02248 [Porcisia hertigi]